MTLYIHFSAFKYILDIAGNENGNGRNRNIGEMETSYWTGNGNGMGMGMGMIPRQLKGMRTAIVIPAHLQSTHTNLVQVNTRERIIRY